MIREVICIGTSFTEGDGLNPYKDDSTVKWYKEHKGIEIESITQFSWPSQLQIISNIKTRNLGKCGSSIEYLMRNVEEIIEKEDVSDKFFILEYSIHGQSLTIQDKRPISPPNCFFKVIYFVLYFKYFS